METSEGSYSAVSWLYIYFLFDQGGQNKNFLFKCEVESENFPYFFNFLLRINYAPTESQMTYRAEYHERHQRIGTMLPKMFLKKISNERNHLKISPNTPLVIKINTWNFYERICKSLKKKSKQLWNALPKVNGACDNSARKKRREHKHCAYVIKAQS